MDGGMEGWLHLWMDGWMDGWIDGCFRSFGWLVVLVGCLLALQLVWLFCLVGLLLVCLFVRLVGWQAGCLLALFCPLFVGVVFVCLPLRL